MATQAPRLEQRRGDKRSSTDRRVGNRGRRKDDGGNIKTLVFLCLAALMALIFFLTFETNIGAQINWRKMFFLKNKLEQTFKLGGVSLGMSPDVVRKRHPNLDLASLGRGETAATFKFDGAHYTVWFVNIGGHEKAYRMRYDQSFATRTEEDILDSIGDKHGKPGTSECSKAGDLARKCHFQWWPSGGIALNVSTTEVKSSLNHTRTDVTMIATDTYLDGKRMRNQSQPEQTSSKSGQENNSEKLPF
ncbi:MAG: hypothetical protein H8E36_05490 [Rhodospirillaceae bacterium]|nr:hypothetical protein [Rhodospirillaceae bacterium]